MERPDLSVIIVNWNTRALLDACLATLPAGAIGPGAIGIETIVVDNGSGDGSVAMVRAQHPGVTLIEAGENLGFARANNRGMAVARGRHLLLLNSDTLVRAGALARLAQAADRYPQAGVLGCKLLNADGTLQESWAAFPTLTSELSGKLRRSRTPLADDPTLGRVYAVDWVGGAAFLINRSLYEQIGGLDEGIFMYTEETDYCYRARAAGRQTLYVEGAEITHLGGGSGSRSSAPQLIRLYESKLYFFRKHYGPARAGLLRAGLAARQLALLALASGRAVLKRSDPRAAERSARRTLLRHLLTGHAHRN